MRADLEHHRHESGSFGESGSVTGAASGIGLASARAMAAAGVRVVLVDRDETKLLEACVEIGPGAMPLVVNLLDPASVAGMMPAILEKAGRLDILHANAGSYVGGDVHGGDPDAWNRMLNLNVNATFRTHPRDAAAHGGARRRRHSGHQFGGGRRPGRGRADLHRCKHAVQAFVHTLPRQVVKHGIRVGAVLPGPVVTALLSDWPREKMADALARGSLMQPEEVAEAVIFMVAGIVGRHHGVVVRIPRSCRPRFRQTVAHHSDMSSPTSGL